MQSIVFVFVVALSVVCCSSFGIGYGKFGLKGMEMEKELALQKSLALEKGLLLEKDLALGYPLLGLQKGMGLYGLGPLGPVGLGLAKEKEMGIEMGMKKGLGLGLPYGGLYF